MSGIETLSTQPVPRPLDHLNPHAYTNSEGYDGTGGVYAHLVEPFIQGAAYLLTHEAELLQTADNFGPLPDVLAIKSLQTTGLIPTLLDPSSLSVRMFYADYTDLALKVWSIKARKFPEASANNIALDLVHSPLFDDDDRNYMAQQTRTLRSRYIGASLQGTDVISGMLEAEYQPQPGMEELTDQYRVAQVD